LGLEMSTVEIILALVAVVGIFGIKFWLIMKL